MSPELMTYKTFCDLEEENILEMRDDFVSDNYDRMNSIAFMSLIPEGVFGVSIFGVSSKLYMKYDAIDVDKFTIDETKILSTAANKLIEKSDKEFLILILKTLLFNCQCELGGMYIMMKILRDHLIEQGVNKIDLEC